MHQAFWLKGLGFKRNGAFIRDNQPTQNLDQRGLTGAIFPNDSVYGTLIDTEGCAVQSQSSSITLGYLGYIKYGFRFDPAFPYNDSLKMG
jgi:hypothetical protein